MCFMGGGLRTKPPPTYVFYVKYLNNFIFYESTMTLDISKATDSGIGCCCLFLFYRQEGMKERGY